MCQNLGPAGQDFAHIARRPSNASRVVNDIFVKEDPTVYLIDGYNLLHSLRSEEDDFPRDFGHGRKRLVDLLSQYAIRESARVTVYFDGTPGRGRDVDLARPSLAIEYTGEGEADEAIRVRVATSAHPKRLHVVSSDRAIATACRGEGARVIDSPSFARRLMSCERKLAAAARALAEAEQRKEWEARLAHLRERMLGIGPVEDVAPASVVASLTPTAKDESWRRAGQGTQSESARLRVIRDTPLTSPTPKAELAMTGRVEMASMVDEMLRQVGSFEEVVKEALGAPFPNPSVKPQPSLPDYHKARKRARSSGSGRTRAVG